MPFLEYIEIENFKSYAGKFSIGPLKTFNVVIGPNGSGKSNLMDAVSFVIGEKASGLRVEKLGDLINHDSISQSRTSEAIVCATFILDDGTLRKLTRAVKVHEGNDEVVESVEYRINGQTINAPQYFEALEELNINVEAKNFLLLQGRIESLAEKKPKEYPEIFEIISSAAHLKNEYERVKKVMLKEAEAITVASLKKRNAVLEKKEAEADVNQMKKHKQLIKELEAKILEYKLFRLFHNESVILSLTRQVMERENEVREIEVEKMTIENDLHSKWEEQQKKAKKELNEIEEKIQVLEKEIDDKRLIFIESRELAILLQKKLNTAKKSLGRSRRVDEVQRINIENLERELAELEIQWTAYEEGESRDQGRSVILKNVELEEYYILKVQAQKQSARYLQELNSINREQRVDQDKLEDEMRGRDELKFKIEEKKREKEEAQKRCDKLAEDIVTTLNDLEVLDVAVEEMKMDVRVSNDKISRLQCDLIKKTEQLNDAKFDKRYDDKMKQKEAAVQNLKNAFPGVQDRLINLCKVINNRYKIAVTKVLEKYMDAIIVDTKSTARKCIQYLKNNFLPREIFLPTDSVKPKSLKECLRNIRQPEGVKLIYDLLQFDPAIDRVVQFVTNNILVCETDENAMRVAFEMEIDGHRHNVVSLNGTFFQKSGVISGGSLTLELKAKRWNLPELKTDVNKLVSELGVAVKKYRQESDLKVLELQRKELQARLIGIRSDKTLLVEIIDAIEEEVASLTEELKEYGSRIQKIEKEIRSRDENVMETKERINKVEDEIFANLCDRVGISNIRQYEETELDLNEERAKRRLQFENEKDRYMNELEFARFIRHDRTQNIVERWELVVKQAENALEVAKRTETEQVDKIEKYAANVSQLVGAKVTKMSHIDSMKRNVKRVREDINRLKSKIQMVRRELSTAYSNLEAKKLESHIILKQSRIKGVDIPLEQGVLEEIALESGPDSHDCVTQIVVDYSSLPPHLKCLDNSSHVCEMDATLAKEIDDLSIVLQKTRAPGSGVLRRLNEAEERSKEMDEAFRINQNCMREAKVAFEKIKLKRYEKLMACFEHVSSKIDGIYKELTQNQSAQALLDPENSEEPDLLAVNYNCVAPGKRLLPVENMSAGEKTVAALALLFAIYSYRPATFLVLDEIDATLDNTNIRKIAGYIRHNQIQTIIISLKEEFFSKADCVIGTTSDSSEESIKSEVYIFDLTKFIA